MARKPVEIPPMKTLSECVNSLVNQGYGESFRVKNKMLLGDQNKKSYPPDKVHIANFYRFEGDSDPGDNAILYAIETDDGTYGVLVDAYGSAADTGVSDFIRQVTDIHKMM
jgi:hypothetical protein